MADSYVCSGATIKCTMGTSQAKLTVLPTRTVFLTGKPQANISDHLSMVNLAPFGNCRSMGFPATASATAAAQGTLTPMPCMHNTPFPWMGGKNDYIIKGDPALLKSSTCQCMWGGTISITDDGQGTGSPDMSRKPKEEFERNQPKNDTTKDGSISDKYNKAKQYRKEGFGIVQSIKKANQDVNFKNSRNKEAFMSDDDADLSHSNTHYGENKQYGINCATTTTTFMVRKQGYDVTARARNANEHTDSIAYGLNIYKAWKNQDGSDVTPTMIRDKFQEIEHLEGLKAQISHSYTKRSRSEIYKEVLMNACQEEGYYTFGLSWEGGGGHYTVLKSEKDSAGHTILTNIEPQTGEPFSTIDELIDNLAYPAPSDTVMRTDDKIFNEEYNDLFEI